MESKTNQAIDIAIKLAVLALIVAWCFQILRPFLFPILWGIILAIALEPIYNWFLRKTKGSIKLAATFLTLVLVGFILIPSIAIFDSAVHGLRELKELHESGELVIPAANESVKDWPLIGDSTYELWNQASTNLESFASKYEEQIIQAGKFIFQSLVGTGTTILQLILSIIIAGVLLATPGTGKASEAIFGKLAGAAGHEFIDVSRKTVQSVVKGILGVAIIQSILVGLGFFLAGVPYAGLWAVLVLILAVIQLPPSLVIIPVIIYLFSAKSGFVAGAWSVYLILAGISDNVLKPWLMGRGAAVPMLVIFLGSLGGFIAFGFIGLFAGAIVLSIAYKLAIHWLEISKEPTVINS